jgi:hypothetical protein
VFEIGCGAGLPPPQLPKAIIPSDPSTSASVLMRGQYALLDHSTTTSMPFVRPNVSGLCISSAFAGSRR